MLSWLAAQLTLALLYLPWIVLAGGILVNYVGAKMVVEARAPLSLPGYLGDHLTAFAVGAAAGRLELPGLGQPGAPGSGRLGTGRQPAAARPAGVAA